MHLNKSFFLEVKKQNHLFEHNKRISNSLKNKKEKKTFFPLVKFIYPFIILYFCIFVGLIFIMYQKILKNKINLIYNGINLTKFSI